MHLDDITPLLEANADLIDPIKDQRYLSDVVFTTGIVDAGETYIVPLASAIWPAGLRTSRKARLD